METNVLPIFLWSRFSASSRRWTTPNSVSISVCCADNDDEGAVAKIRIVLQAIGFTLIVNKHFALCRTASISTSNSFAKATSVVSLLYGSPRPQILFGRDPIRPEVDHETACQKPYHGYQFLVLLICGRSTHYIIKRWF